MTCSSSPVLLSATLIPFSLVTVLLTSVSVILGVVVYRIKVPIKKMKMKLNERELGVQTVEMEKISEYASISIDVKTTPTSRQYQVPHNMNILLTGHYLHYCPCRIQYHLMKRCRRIMPMESWNTLSEMNCGIYDWIISTIAIGSLLDILFCTFRHSTCHMLASSLKAAELDV